ncbi:MAG: molybdopterin synthase sulfur carrier subunit [Chloroflexi bacterium]|nr:molybdopterin synthase sulfur carrier subunit [Chloroflexota bacterium]HCU74020.1 molybdopterin synthase sulfur carrier subunit [Chloroflexota bacterium]|tara:strand:- start:1551 stop:1826 length:276 start_codon:yes stop_codon:yes gene_type:complete
MPQVRIPTPLRNLTDGQNTVDIEATTVGALVKNLDAAHPGFAERLLDEEGELRRFVNIYVNGEDIRFHSGFDTEISSNDEVSIVPSVAGGN